MNLLLPAAKNAAFVPDDGIGVQSIFGGSPKRFKNCEKIRKPETAIAMPNSFWRTIGLGRPDDVLCQKN